MHRRFCYSSNRLSARFFILVFWKLGQRLPYDGDITANKHHRSKRSYCQQNALSFGAAGATSGLDNISVRSFADANSRQVIFQAPDCKACRRKAKHTNRQIGHYLGNSQESSIRNERQFSIHDIHQEKLLCSIRPYYL